MKAGSVFKRISCALFPRRCAYCGAVIESSRFSCDECEKKLKRIEPPVCTYCGRNREKCNCNKKQNHFKSVAAPFYYEGIARRGLTRMKFNGKTYAAEAFSEEMLRTVENRYSDVKFDLMASVPMTKKQMKKRGYNQSELLSQMISKKLGLEYNPDLLVKLYEISPQHTLKGKERYGNVFGVFDVSAPEAVKGKTVLLCDDIKTTGATLNECAKILKINGAAEVYCICAAMT